MDAVNLLPIHPRGTISSRSGNNAARARDLFSFAKNYPLGPSTHAMKLRLLWPLVFVVKFGLRAEPGSGRRDRPFSRRSAGQWCARPAYDDARMAGARARDGRSMGKETGAADPADSRMDVDQRGALFSQHRHHVLHVCRPRFSLREHLLSLRKHIHSGWPGTGRAGARSHTVAAGKSGRRSVAACVPR